MEGEYLRQAGMSTCGYGYGESHYMVGCSNVIIIHRGLLVNQRQWQEMVDSPGIELLQLELSSLRHFVIDYEEELKS